jgi:serine/threonine protein kinase
VTPERWEQVTAIFHAALTRETSERAAYLNQACAGDQSLRAEVDGMLGAHFTEGMRLVSGAAIGTYRVEGLIGAGGMGEVYRAVDTKFNRPVAIKFLSGDLADSGARRRFQREAQTTSSLNHPHILTVYDVGEFEGRQYLVSEFVDGGTLREWA